jgi:hypothetical protein
MRSEGENRGYLEYHRFNDAVERRITGVAPRTSRPKRRRTRSRE